MTPRSVTGLAAAALLFSLLVSPALAAHSKAPHPGKSTASKGPSGPTGPTGARGPNGKAYGYYCQNQSRKHVAGQKGTPFSRCVTAMAKLANGNARTPRAACAAMSKTHPAGEKGTPYSRCVAAGAKLLKDQHR